MIIYHTHTHTHTQGLIELQKAQRTLRQFPSWERNDVQRERVVTLTIKYSQSTKYTTVV